MTHKKHLINTKMIKQPNKVADYMECSVLSGGRRGISVAVAAKVGGDATVAKGREREELVAPAVPELREAV